MPSGDLALLDQVELTMKLTNLDPKTVVSSSDPALLEGLLNIT